MNKLIVLIFILSARGIHASAQLLSGKQHKIAETYLNLILKGQQEETWALFDKANVPAVTKEQFALAFTQIQKSLALFDTFKLASIYSRDVSKKIFNVYRFEAASKIQKILTDVFVDVIFLDTSSFIAGMQSSVKPKDSTSLTSMIPWRPIR